MGLCAISFWQRDPEYMPPEMLLGGGTPYLRRKCG